jgi:hypothetical protein
MGYPFQTVSATETANFVDITLNVGPILAIDFYQRMYEHGLRVLKSDWVSGTELRALCEKLPTFKVLP